MDEAAQVKVCPFCAETVKASARICPHCQSKLVRFARFRQEAAIGLVVLWLCAIFGAIIALLAPPDAREGRSFQRHRSDLSVGRLAYESRSGKGKFQIAGYVTNAGGYAWRVAEVQVIFSNAEGGKIDVQNHRFNEVFVVQPAREAAFCFPVYSAHPDAQSAQLTGRVLDARDGNLPLDPD
jgi:hypothetical protein